ncbi:LCP family protein [Clostridium frigidicarnis]|uniref:Cell envelope-related function transcriptional attenuator common domain-containing protein n=1 Tax=Clostridium frigidicarnis TaxID=84698 RepID=A0A1I0VYJ9_9CLOT|nr:LCP family protein [Clostridium frigidicarnis]SFA81442.1 cell envelope-related function transcriptional attenuator common domain-containing protein [Clostridium frigidicarnis]
MSTRMDKYHSTDKRPTNRNTKPRPRPSSNGARRPNPKKRRRKKKNPTARIILLSLALLFLLGLGGGAYYVVNLLGKVNTEKINKANLGVDDDLNARLKSLGKDNIINIALFGLDKTNEEERGRSDATMVLSIDADNKKIRLISLMRDSYVSIDGHGKDKLNHAHAFGGPELAIKTINKNFNLNITDFVSVDFAHMQKVIDALGGVEIDVKPEEVKIANQYVVELAKLGRTDPDYIDKAGKQTLSGMQALSYTRIRYVGNGDFERTDRQRRVLEALFDKIKNAGPTEFPKIVSDLLPMVTTSLSSTDIMKLGSDLLLKGVTNLEQERFPVDGDYVDGGKTINGVWYLPFDEKATKDKLHKYIFEDIKPSITTSN